MADFMSARPKATLTWSWKKYAPDQLQLWILLHMGPGSAPKCQQATKSDLPTRGPGLRTGENARSKLVIR